MHETVSHKKDMKGEFPSEAGLNEYFKLKCGYKAAMAPGDQTDLRGYYTQQSNITDNRSEDEQSTDQRADNRKSQNQSSLMERFRNQEKIDIMKAHLENKKHNLFVDFSSTQNSFQPYSLSESNNCVLDRNKEVISVPKEFKTD